MSLSIQQLDRNMAVTQPGSKLAWYDLRQLTIEGQGWQNTEGAYDRLPVSAKGRVREALWQLGQHSAGIAARFVTASTTLAAQWTLRFPSLAMDHMASTGVSGLDLYAHEEDGWHWVGVGRIPEYPQTLRSLATELPPAQREYALYLPLYNGVTDVRIGIDPESTIAAAPRSIHKPICFYGTSVTQGGCASRPGMAYPAILGRRLARPTINLGFSGNALAEEEVAQLLAELDPSVYVLDCLPNMTTELVAQRMGPLVHTLRQAHPRTPLILVEHPIPGQARYKRSVRDRCMQSNAALRGVFAQLLSAGETNVQYLPCDHLLGDSGQATVDGAHPTDVGFLALADAMEPLLRRVLA